MISITPLKAEHVKRKDEVIKVKCRMCSDYYESSNSDDKVDKFFKENRWQRLSTPFGCSELCNKCADRW